MTTSGFVYFIGAPDGEAIKIGFSIKPENRIRQVQSGNPARLEVLHLFPARKSVERQLHTLFRPSRLTGEWFTNAAAIRNFARHVEFCHAARALKLMKLDGWPADEETQLRVLDRYDAVTVTEANIARAAADIFPEEAAKIGMRRRVLPQIPGWPASRAELPQGGQP